MKMGKCPELDGQNWTDRTGLRTEPNVPTGGLRVLGGLLVCSAVQCSANAVAVRWRWRCWIDDGGKRKQRMPVRAYGSKGKDLGRL